MKLENLYTQIIAPAVALASTVLALYISLTIYFKDKIVLVESNRAIIITEVLLSALGLSFLIIILAERASRFKNYLKRQK